MTREDLYRTLDASKLVGAYQTIVKAIEEQAGKAEKYPSTQYTASASEGMHQTALSLREIGEELRAWHVFLHSEDGSRAPPPFLQK